MTAKDGQQLAWADIDDRHLWNIVRMMTRVVRDHGLAAGARRYMMSPESRRECRRAWRETQRLYLREDVPRLSRAWAEVDRRGLMPTQDDLRVAWDLACACGAAGDGIKGPHCFVELWVAFRGESTTTPEYLASRQESAQA